jgi:hypothetical protein
LYRKAEKQLPDALILSLSKHMWVHSPPKIFRAKVFAASAEAA